MKKIATYSRVSTLLQENEKTIESQIAEQKEFCKTNKYLLVEVYKDDGFSGSILERPALDKLRDDARGSKFDAILFHSVDRLSRNHIHAGIVIEELKKQGIEVIFLNSPSTDTPEGKLLFNIQSVVGEYEKEKIRERTRRGKLYKAKQGKLVGNTAPYGYRYDKKSGLYVIHHEEAGVVRLIFDLYTKRGYSLRKIIKELYNKKIKPLKGRETWAMSSLSRLISNESYKGIAYYNRTQSFEPAKPKNNNYKRIQNSARRIRPREEWLPIKVPSITDEQTFNHAQEIRRINQRHSLRNCKYPYLFRGGILVHSNCGSKMHGYNAKYAQYRCSNRVLRYPLEKTCDAMINQNKLDSVVWDTIKKILWDSRIITIYLKRKERGKKKDLEGIKQALEVLNQGVEKITLREQRLVSAYSDGILSSEQLRISVDDLNHKKDGLLKEKGQKESEYKNVATISNKRLVKKILKQLSKIAQDNTYETKYNIVKTLVERAEYNNQKVLLNLRLLPIGQPINKDKILSPYHLNRGTSRQSG